MQAVAFWTPSSLGSAAKVEYVKSHQHALGYTKHITLISLDRFSHIAGIFIDNQ